MVLIGCAVVGAVGGAVLVGHPPGLGLAVVGALAWLPAVPALVRRRSVADGVVALLSVALLGVAAVRDAAWLVAVAGMAAALLAAVAVTGARTATGIALGPSTWALGVLRAVPWAVRGAGARLRPATAQLLVAVRAIAVTVLLLVVFGLLFASADEVFASYLPQVVVDRLPARIVVAVLVAGVVAGLAHVTLAPPSWARATLPPGRPSRRGEWLLPIAALDGLVVAFVAVQVGALVGGHEYVLRTAGLSYAEYAREGFGQLVAVTALTLVVVAVAVRHAPRAAPGDVRLVRAALGVLCLGTLGVVASALRRMDLYVEAFGLTRLRVAVVVLEIVLGAVLLLVMAAGVHRRGTWLPRAVVHVGAVAVLGLAVANPDAMIVRHNTTADLDVALDVGYLRGLSADAVPAMAELPEPLRSCLLGGVATPDPTGLPGWNLGRARAADVLAGATVDDGACAQVRGDARG